MFCYLESVELTTQLCPAKSCVYQNQVKQCAYKELTSDTDEAGKEIPVTPHVVANLKGLKLYKVKEEMTRGKLRVKVGLAVLRYSEYLKSIVSIDVAVDLEDLRRKRHQLKWGPDDVEAGDSMAKISDLLLHRFGLGFEHQTMFFDPAVFKAWKATLPEGSSASSDGLTLPLFVDALKAVVSKPNYLNPI